jgi:hypothetical protein
MDPGYEADSGQHFKELSLCPKSGRIGRGILMFLAFLTFSEVH